MKHLAYPLLGLLITVVLIVGCGIRPGFNSQNSDESLIMSNGSKTISNTYTYFFRDYVSDNSAAYWTATNNGGHKTWVLSTANYYNAPRAWIIGQNYWNGENDTLESNAFTVPSNRSDIHFVFYGRWRVLAGDYGYAEYRINAGAWQSITGGTFTNGQNASYPSWDKYTFTLPATGGSSASYQVRFRFTSNSSGTDWGFGADAVSVYQVDLNPPTSVGATDGSYTDKVRISWSPPSGVTPTGYKVYRATSQSGSYGLLGSVSASPYDDTSATAGTTYWYKVISTHSGYPDSVYSLADSGYRASPPSWHLSVVASSAEGIVNKGTGLASVNGKPAVAFIDDYSFTSGIVQYSQATDANGTSWNTPVTVSDNQGYVDAGYPKLLVVSSRPAIAYYISGATLYQRASDSNGASWGGAANVADTGWSLSNCAFFTANGNPAVVFANDNPGSAFNRSSDTNGGSWPTTYYQISTDGGDCSGAVLSNGNPAMTYCRTNSGYNKLYFCSASDTSGSSWNGVQQINTTSYSSEPSMAIVNVRPAVVYMNSFNMFFLRASDSTGSSWPSPTNIQSNIVGAMSLAIVNGVPAVAFCKSSGGDNQLWVMEAAASDGSSWNTSELIDSASGVDVGTSNCVAQINGHLAISYAYDTYSNANTKIKFAIRY